VVHKSDDFKKFESDLKQQEKMNIAFIKGLPKISEESVKELGRETEEGVVPEFIPPEKIKKYKRGRKIGSRI